jgi:translocation and assembly module TamB
LKKALAILGAIVVSAALVAGTAFVARELDRYLTERMAALKDQTMAALAALLDRRVSYGSISPSFLRSLDVRDLVIFDSEDPQKALLSIHNIRVSYSLAELLLQRDPVGALREVQILNTSFSIDLEKDKDLVDLFLRLVKGNGGGAGPLRVRFTGSNVNVAIVGAGFTTSLEGLFFQIEARQSAINVSLRGNCSGTLSQGFTFASAMNVQGSLDRSLTGSDLTVRLLSFRNNLFSMGSQTMQVVWKGNVVDVRKIQDRSPVALELLADLEKRELTVNFQSQDMRPDRLVTLGAGLAKYGTWMSVPLTASGHVTWRMPDRSLEYAVDASAYLEDQLPVHNVMLDSSFRGNDKELYFFPLRVSSASGAMEFSGNIRFSDLFPDGYLTVSNLDPGSGEKVSGRLSIERRAGGLNVLGSHFVLGQIDFDQLALSITPAEDGASFSLSTSFAGGHPGDLVQAGGEIRFKQSLKKAVVEGDAGSITAPTLALSGILRNIPPEKLYHLFMGAGALSQEQKDIYDILSGLTVSADVSFATDFAGVSVRSRQVTVTDRTDPGTMASFALAADNEHFSFTNFSGTWKKLTLSGSFDGKFASAGQLSFTSDVRFLSTFYSFKGSYSRALGLQATGSYGLQIAASPLRDGTLYLHLKATGFPVPVPGRTLPVTLNVSGLVTPQGEWSADFSSVVVKDIPFLRSQQNTFEVAGKLTKSHLDISRVVFTDAFSQLMGSASLDIALPQDLLDPNFFDAVGIKGNATLRGPGGAETYSATGAFQKGALSLAVTLDGAPLDRIGQSALKGSLSGSGTVSGPVGSPSIDLNVALKNGRLGTDNLQLSGELLLGPDAMLVRSLNGVYLSHKLTQGTGGLDFAKGTASFNALYQGEYFGDVIQLSLGVNGKFSSPTLGDLLGGFFDSGAQGTLALNGITIAKGQYPAWNVGFKVGSGRLSFDGGPGNSLHGWVDSSRAFSLGLADPLPISGTAVGSLQGDRLSANVQVETLDLLVLNTLLKTPNINTTAGAFPIIKFTSGVATGALTVNGPVNDPDFTGQLDVIGGGMVSAYSPDEAGPVRAIVTFDGKSFHTSKVTAAAGSARLTAEARFPLDHWSPTGFDISISTDGNTPVRLRGRFGRFMADGSGAGQVRIIGDDRKTTVTGNLVITDCRMSLGDAPPGGAFEPEETPTYVTLTATTGKRVEFTWPSQDLPVIRSTAAPGGSVAITYRGDTGAYTIKGTTGVQGGEIYYFDRSFIMKKGTITFNEDQTDFDPWIKASAEVREWDPYTGEEVKIALDADSPLSKFSPRFSSDPPRSESAILAMIGAPILTRAETQGIGLSAVLVYSDYLSQTWILRPFEQKVRQLLDLDLFSIRTQILQNLVAQKFFGSTLNPLDNTSVSLGKYIGNDLFWEMLVRLQQPPVAAGQPLPPGSTLYGQLPTGVGVAPGSLPTFGTGLQPDLELSIEWATPLFLLTWTWVPQHPESMFLEDNSLSFSWKFSY